MPGKKFEELTFTDDYMFCKVLENNEDLCRRLTELLTGRKIRNIIHPVAQKAITIRPDRKGVRFDVYFEDDDNVIYNIEMQNSGKRDLPRRIRYYNGSADISFLQSGGKYKDLKDLYIVFICTFNPFKEGLHKYTFENRCAENANIVLGDGVKKIMLCSEGSADDISEEMKEFLGFIGGNLPQSDLTKQIDDCVSEIKADEKWEREYMGLSELMDEEELEMVAAAGTRPVPEKNVYPLTEEKIYPPKKK